MYWNDWRVHILIAVLAVAVVYYLTPVLLYLVFVLLAALSGAALAVLQGSYERRRRETYPKPPEPRTGAALSRIKVYPPPRVRPMLFSGTVDGHIQEVIDLTLKHHVIPTYQGIGSDHEAFFRSVMPEVWNVLGALVDRVGQIDMMKLISQDMVRALRVHFELFHGMHFRDPQFLPKFPNLEVYPYLENPEHELNFLRQACEVLLCVSLRKEILQCTPVRVLLREYLVCSIIQPTIEMICDPDYINQKLLAYLIEREEVMNSAQKKYAYSTYEDFMKHLRRCEDVMELQQIRQFIITDIIQAKAVQKMKTSRTTGISSSQFPIPIPADKARSLMERNLETYTTQLRTAKTFCERQIQKLGGEDYHSEAENYTEFQTPEFPLGIPFETIMKNEVTRAHFSQFLEQCGFAHFLQFWVAVENLDSAPPDSQHKNVKSIYDEFLSPSASSAIYADVELVHSVEQYLSCETTSCVAVLAKIQESIYRELYDQFYQSFIASESYRDLMQQGAEGGDTPFPSLTKLSEAARVDSPSFDPSLDDSRYKQKLKSLKMELEEKDDALKAMPEKVQSSSLSQRKKALQKDRSILEEEIKKLEHYVEHTEEWFGTIGQWSIDIHSVDLSKEGNHDKDPLFIIVVHRPETMRSGKVSKPQTETEPPLLLPADEAEGATAGQGSFTGSETSSEISEIGEGDLYQSRGGWVVGRRLSEFQNLHTKVVEISPNLQFPPQPRWLNPFQKPDAHSNYWQTYRHALEVYLGQIMQDMRLQESEDVFNFLSPASENLRRSSAVPPEKKRLSFHLSVPGMGMFSKDHEEPKEDSVADQMYLLVSEIFELDEWSRVLRKQLMDLVQLTYGKSIDRELQEFMNWVVSEPMLVFYLQTFRNAMWPDGLPAPPAPTRSDEQKSRTKEEAKKKFLRISPQTLATILGQRNCQIGFLKIFEAFQDPRANKQLFYSLFEILLYAIVPELERVEIEDTGADWKSGF